jgi:pimeloyl-ACP methyl ester carboxylesterase
LDTTRIRRPQTAPTHIRALFGALSRLTPGTAERLAARSFLTPRGAWSRTPSELHAKLLPEREQERRTGEADHASLLLPTGRVPIWSWGKGPTVLMVHGWSGSAGDMAPIAAELVRAGYRAVLFDMPGHGVADHVPTDLPIFVRTMAAIAELVCPFEAVVAHSLGATAAATALGTRQVLAERAVLLAPGLSPWAFTGRFAEGLGLHPARVSGMVRHIEARVGIPIGGMDAAEAARALQIPGYIVHDPGDPEVPYAHAGAIVTSWPNARLVSKPGLGHRRILRDQGTIDGIVRFIRGDAKVMDPTPGLRRDQRQSA